MLTNSLKNLLILCSILLITSCIANASPTPTATPPLPTHTTIPTPEPSPTSAPPTPTPTPAPPPLPPLQPITIENAHQVRLLATLELPGFRTSSFTQCNVSFSSVGNLMSATCLANHVPVWDLETLQVVNLLYPQAQQIGSCEFSPNGQTLACGKYSNPRTIQIFNPYSGEMTTELRQHYRAVWEVAFHPNGEYLAGCSVSETFAATGEVLYWEINSRERLWRHEPEYNVCLSISFHPDGETLAMSSILGMIEILDAETGEPLTILQDASRNIGDLTYSPSGKFLAAGTDDSKIFIWETDNYQMVTSFFAHQSYVNGVDFSDNETLLVSGSDDGTVAIWAVEGFQLLNMLEGHEDTVLRVEINSSSTLIGSVSWDGTVRLWGIPKEEH